MCSSDQCITFEAREILDRKRRGTGRYKLARSGLGLAGMPSLRLCDHDHPSATAALDCDQFAEFSRAS
jgi:hypothetical protein